MKLDLNKFKHLIPVKYLKSEQDTKNIIILGSAVLQSAEKIQPLITAKNQFDFIDDICHIEADQIKIMDCFYEKYPAQIINKYFFLRGATSI